MPSGANALLAVADRPRATVSAWAITDGWRDILEEPLLSSSELDALLADMALQLTGLAGS